MLTTVLITLRLKTRITDFQNIWSSLSGRQRAAILFCEQQMRKRCGKDYKRFLNKYLKKSKRKAGWKNVNSPAAFYIDSLLERS